MAVAASRHARSSLTSATRSPPWLHAGLRMTGKRVPGGGSVAAAGKKTVSGMGRPLKNWCVTRLSLQMAQTRALLNTGTPILSK